MLETVVMLQLVDILLLLDFLLMHVISQHLDVFLMIVLLFLQFLLVVLDHIVIPFQSSVFVLRQPLLKSLLLDFKEVFELSQLLFGPRLCFSNSFLEVSCLFLDLCFELGLPQLASLICLLDKLHLLAFKALHHFLSLALLLV